MLLKKEEYNNFVIYFYDILSSTNDICLKSDYSNFDVVVSTVQTKGKGSRNREWQSNKGGLWFSFVLDLDKNKQENILQNITFFLVIILQRVLSNYTSGITIKWPNDIFYEDKKLGGILCESIYCGNECKKIICGIGININNEVVNYEKGNNQLNAINLKEIIRKEKGNSNSNSNSKPQHKEVEVEIKIENILFEFLDEFFINYENYNFLDIYNEFLKYDISMGKKILYKEEHYNVIFLNSDFSLSILNIKTREVKKIFPEDDYVFLN